jgi:hypothetical protein
LSDPSLSQDELDRIAVEAYLYFYPLVLMETTRRVSTNSREGARAGVGPMDTLVHSRAFPSAKFRTIVRPNFDTLYSSAWLDLSNGPFVISLPAMRDRFFMLPLYDMWTDVFASPGTRTHGEAPLTFALCTPEWRGALPSGVARINAPTPTVWVLGRTETRGVEDYSTVHEIQDQIRLTPLSTWPEETVAPGREDPDIDMKTPPMLQVDRMSTNDYFATAAQLAQIHPAHATDWGMLVRMARTGLVVGEPFELDHQSNAVIEAFHAAREGARRVITTRGRTISRRVNGWDTIDDLGVYANAYVKRAMIAKWGLGANPTEEAIYPNLQVDDAGETLNGTHRYVLRFTPEEIPPVDAFWSITVYDRLGFPVANELDRFALGDRDNLVFQANGSLEILLAHARPDDDWVPNWLPVPMDEFVVTMRLYLPRDAAISQRWTPPATRRLD